MSYLRLAAASLCVFGAFAANTDVLQAQGNDENVSLSALVRQALETSPRLRAAELELEAAREGVPIQAGKLLPTLSANARTGERRTRPNAATDFSDKISTKSLNLQQVLVNFADVHQLRGAKRAANAAEHGFRAERQEFIAEIAGAWLDLHLADDRVRLLRARIRSTRAQRDFLARLADEDIGDRLDVVLVEAEIDGLLAQAEEARGERENAAGALARLAGTEIPPGQLPALDPDFIPAPPGDSGERIARALENNPRLLQTRQQAEQLLEQFRAAKAGHLPSISIVGQLDYARPSDQSFIGLQAQIPLFSGGQISAQSRQARLRHLAALKTIENIADQVRQDVAARHRTAEALIRSAHSLRSAANRRRLHLKKIRESWREGFHSTYDVIRAEQDLFDARLRLQTAHYNYLRAMTLLHRLNGTLDESRVEQLSRLFAGRCTSVHALACDTIRLP